MNVPFRRTTTARMVPGLFSLEDQPAGEGGVDKGRAASWPKPRRHDRLEQRRPWWQDPTGCGAGELRNR